MFSYRRVKFRIFLAVLVRIDSPCVGKVLNPRGLTIGQAIVALGGIGARGCHLPLEAGFPFPNANKS